MLRERLAAPASAIPIAAMQEKPQLVAVLFMVHAVRVTSTTSTTSAFGDGDA